MNPLDHEIAQILASLSVTSNGRIYSYQPIGSKGGFSSSPPKSGDSHPPHIFWRLEYERQEFDQGRRSVIDRARTELEGIRKRQAPQVEGETADQLQRRILKDGEGLNVSEASVHFRCGPRDVRRARIANGRDAETGVTKATEDHQVIQARRLVGQGCSQRQIALIMGVSQPTIHRLLRA